MRIGVALLGMQISAQTLATIDLATIIAFFAFAALNVAELLPRIIVDTAGPLSRFFLVTAMAAIGLKLPWRSITAYGWLPVLLLTLLSAVLMVLVAIFLVCAPS